MLHHRHSRLTCPASKHRHTLPSRRCRGVQPVHAAAKRAVLKPDVVVIGAGIIGLLTAEALLKENLSVVLVERGKQLCTGATGAGQGYLWMAHRNPATPAWDLATASMAMWRNRVKEDPKFAVGIEFQTAGSLLLATTASEAQDLKARQDMLLHHGIKAQCYDAGDVHRLEPSLRVPEGGAGLLVGEDAQINGRKTAALLLENCRSYGNQFQALMDETVSDIELQAPNSTTVSTDKHTLQPGLGTVVAAGVWSGALLSAVTGDPRYQAALQPRRGHLLEVDRPAGMPPLKHGTMEMSYTKHYSAADKHTHTAAAAHSHSGVDITFTATTSAAGTLLLGSSREFSGWSKEPSPGVVQAILDHAATFMPHLAGVGASGEAVRVGLRPFAVGGMPIVGPVPGAPGLFMAAGHEGSGLCLGLATAALLKHYMLGAQQVPASTPHAYEELLPQNRLLVAEL